MMSTADAENNNEESLLEIVHMDRLLEIEGNFPTPKSDREYSKDDISLSPTVEIPERKWRRFEKRSSVGSTSRSPVSLFASRAPKISIPDAPVASYSLSFSHSKRKSADSSDKSEESDENNLTYTHSRNGSGIPDSVNEDDSKSEGRGFLNSLKRYRSGGSAKNHSNSLREESGEYSLMEFKKSDGDSSILVSPKSEGEILLGTGTSSETSVVSPKEENIIVAKPKKRSVSMVLKDTISGLVKRARQ